MTQFNPIIPDPSTLWPGLTLDVWTGVVDDTLKLINDDFEATVATWKAPAEFTTDRAHSDGSDVTGDVYTDNEIYGYVNNGTKPHQIVPRVAKKLHFLSGYSPKTAKRVLGSTSGGANGGDVFAQAVQHPGSEAREFDQAIVEKRQSDMESIATAAVAQAAKVS